MRGLFVTGTGTGIGKTHVTAAIVRALRTRGHDVVALKPIETGCLDGPEDARLLAAAADRPELADLPGLVRFLPPLAPAAIHETKPSIDTLAAAVRRAAGELTIVEGAGGLLVPYDDDHDLADLAHALALPLLVVAPNRLGVLHDVRATVECAERRGLEVRAVLLSAVAAPDLSAEQNAALLARRLTCPVISWPRTSQIDAPAMVENMGLLRRLALVSF